MPVRNVVMVGMKLMIEPMPFTNLPPIKSNGDKAAVNTNILAMVCLVPSSSLLNLSTMPCTQPTNSLMVGIRESPILIANS